MLPVVLYAIYRFSCLHRLLMERVPGPKYVSVIHFCGNPWFEYALSAVSP
jgi:hypothetical protein